MPYADKNKKRAKFREWYANLDKKEKDAWNARARDGRRIRYASFSPEEQAVAKQLQNDWRRESKFRKRYGVELEVKIQKFHEQNGLCEICSCEMILKSHTRNSACQDHDHITKELRDVLCTNCNAAIGLFREDITSLLTAIAYLQKHAKSSGVRGIA